MDSRGQITSAEGHRCRVCGAPVSPRGPVPAARQAWRLACAAKRRRAAHRLFRCERRTRYPQRDSSLQHNGRTPGGVQFRAKATVLHQATTAPDTTSPRECVHLPCPAGELRNPWQQMRVSSLMVVDYGRNTSASPVCNIRVVIATQSGDGHCMSRDRDYLLGTHEEELARLGLQHRVWRPVVLDCWQRAGMTVGKRVLDVGAGPGYAAVDLAEIVGPTGKVIVLER